jgi:tetratricopeptide (TPR) repeat protein
MRWCRAAIEVAEACGEKDALAHALKVLGWAEMDHGQVETADSLVRALDLYRELDDLPGQASVLNMLGGFAYWRGEWDDALDRYGRALELAGRTRNFVLEAFCRMNIGEIALDRGRLDEAAELFAEANDVWEAAGDRPASAYAKCNLARVASRSGRHDEARALFEASESESRAVGAHFDALEASARAAEGLLLAGDPNAALLLADETLARARALGGLAPQSPLLHRVRGAAYLRTGNVDAAAQALDASLRDAKARKAGYDLALTQGVMAELAARTGRGSPDDLRAESRATLSRLGVVSTPDLLGTGSDDPNPD